jgi:hypothetical protein
VARPRAGRPRRRGHAPRRMAPLRAVLDPNIPVDEPISVAGAQRRQRPGSFKRLACCGTTTAGRCSAAGSSPSGPEVADPPRGERGRGGAPGERVRPAPLFSMRPTARPSRPGRADGTRPRHLSFFASARKPWSADNAGSAFGPPRRTVRTRLAHSGAAPWKERKDVDEQTTRKPTLLFRLFGLFLLRSAARALS